MNKTRVCIVDDEKLARRAIAQLLASDTSIEIVGEASNGEDAVRLLTEQQPDIVFLDIEMAGCTGFETLQRLDLPDPPLVVFVTAHDQHALKAFEVEALDFLLKPFTDEAFYRVLERAKRRIRQEQRIAFSKQFEALAELFLESISQRDRGEREAQDSPQHERLVFRVGGEIRVIQVQEIDWLAAAEHYIEIHTGAGKLLVRDSIAHVGERLPASLFYRIHRSTIVNTTRIKRIVPVRRGDYDVILIDGTSLRLSRSRAAGLKTLLNMR